MFKKINFVMCACVVVALLATDVARAVEYDKIPPPSMTRDEENLARDFKRGKAPSTDAAKAALGKEVLAALAKFTNPDEAANYTQLRKNIEGFLKERSQSAEARAVIVNTLVTGASSIAARNNYSPAARINCLAILAMLDQKAETRIDNGIAAPQPAESAYPTLKGVAERPTMPYYLRAIALQGVERHASVYFKGGWDNQKKGEVVRLANSIVDSKPATALDAKAHAWLVRRGYDLLTTCGVATAYKTALAHVADAETLPSVRLAALGYLSSVDLARMPDADKSNYFVGLSHLTRSQLVSWYEYENDLISRAASSSTPAGGMQGGMGGMGGYGDMGGMGDMGGGYGDMGGMGDMGGGYGDMGGMGDMGGGYGDMGGYGGTTPAAPKPIDTQDWQTRAARRLLNQITQKIHVALDGKPLKDESPVYTYSFASATAGNAELQQQVTELVDLLDEFQEAINDAVKIEDIASILDESKTPIENIMDFSIEVPGFLKRYPELADDEEDLQKAEKPKPMPNNGGAPADGGPGAPADGQPTGDGTTPPGPADANPSQPGANQPGPMPGEQPGGAQ